MPELARLARAIARWETPILRWHRTRLTNAATEGTNLIIKNIKRLGFGFTNFDNYRLRLLLRCGAPWQHPQVASIRRRQPRISAVCLLFASLMFVPLIGLGAAELEGRVRPGQRAEAFSWLRAAQLVGGGLGIMLNGFLIDHVEAFIVPLLAAALYAWDCPTVCVTGRDPRVRDRVSRAGEDHDHDHFF